MKINLKPTEQNLALLKQINSKNKIEAENAHVALAAFMGPILQEVINNAATLSALFKKFTFNEGDSPSIPLDLYRDVAQDDFLRVWSQSEAGGMPYNQPTPVTSELKFSTYRLDSAIAFNKKYAAQSRLDVVAKSMTRLAQEVMLKQERNSAALLLRAIANAKTKVKGVDTPHVLRSQEANRLILHDFNRIFTLVKRIRTAWNGGTPEGGRSRGLTDLIVSPEIVQELRALAYNPISTRSIGDATKGVTDGIALPEDARKAIYQSAGIPEFYGVNIMEINELGVGYAYNDLFKYFAGTTAYPNYGGIGGADVAFDNANEEIVLGLDLSSMDSLLRPVAVDAENGSEFRVTPDDQFVARSNKVGFYGSLEEGRLILDDKNLTALIV